MPSDAVDSVFVELINAAAEVAYSLSVKEKPNIMFTGWEDTTGGNIANLTQSDFIFKGKFEGVFDGRFMVAVPEILAKAFAETLTGAGEPQSIDSSEKSAIYELMNNISVRWAAIWADGIGRDINIANSELLDPGTEPPPDDESWIEISAGVAVGMKESMMKVLFPTAMVDVLDKKIAPATAGFDQTETEEVTEEESVDVEPEVKEEIEEEEEDNNHNIRQAQFQQLQAEPTQSDSDRQIDLILDVPLLVSVELGRKDLTIREILELSPGSLIELNQLAGEPVDLLINGKLFARGEVVVIDENFGIRVTHIISPQERVEKLR